MDTLAPSVSEPVGDAEVVELALTVVLAVMDAVPVPLRVGEPVAVPVGVLLLVALLLTEVLPVLVAEGAAGRDGVALTERVAEALSEASHCALLNSSQGSLLPGTTPKARTSTAAAPLPAAGMRSAAVPLGRGAALDRADMTHCSAPPRTPQRAAARGFKPLALVASSAAEATAPLLETTSEATAPPAAAPLPCAHAATTLPSAASDSRVPAVTLASSRSGGAGAPSASSSSCVCVASSRCVLFVPAAMPRLRTKSVARRPESESAGPASACPKEAK
jgi:hypothetical protein